jgi:hypothetical protein
VWWIGGQLIVTVMGWSSENWSITFALALLVIGHHLPLLPTRIRATKDGGASGMYGDFT